MNFTLDALLALDAIERHGSFAAAARALNKVQSAVSYGIKQLEEGLGLQLFDRSRQRASLTPAGRAILDEARDVLSRARRLESIAARFHDDWEPRLEVIIDGILPMTPIMNVLSHLAEEAVPTRIQLKVEFLGGVQDCFERDRADLMLVKEYTPSPNLVAHPLPEVTCVLVAASSHRLAQGNQLELTDLHRYMELAVHDSSTSSRLTNAHLFGGARVFYLSDFSAKHRALLRGLGFGWMPLSQVAPDLASGRLVQLDYRPGARFRFTPALVHPIERPLGRAGDRFLQLLTEAQRPGERGG